MRARCITLLATCLAMAACDKARNKPKQEVEVTVAAIGKIEVKPPANSAASAAGSSAEKLFYEDQVRILGSNSLHQRVEALLLRTHPEMKVAPVTVQIIRTEQNPVLSVVARSTNGDLARAFADELMAAYVETKKSSAESDVTPEIAKARKDLLEAERRWASFKLDHDPARLAADEADFNRLVRRFEASIKWFKDEIGAVSGITPEEDIKRRQAAPPLPAEIPSDFALAARQTPTMGELGYLSALKSGNEAAIRSAAATATKDRESRIENLKRQIDLIQDLLADTRKKLAEVTGFQTEAHSLQAEVSAAGKKLNDFTEKHKDGTLNGSDLDSPGVARIVEKAAIWSK